MHDGWATLTTVWAAYFAPSSAAHNQRNAADSTSLCSDHLAAQRNLSLQQLRVNKQAA